MRLFRTLIIAVTTVAVPLTSFGWTGIFGGDSLDRGNCVTQTSDNNFIITGEWASEPAAWNSGFLWLLKTDGYGKTIWSRSYGEGVGESVLENSEGEYVVTGIDLDPWELVLLKVDADGNTEWRHNYGSGRGLCVKETEDGGYIIAGFSGWEESSLWLIKTDSLGDTLWTSEYGYGVGYSVEETSDGGYIVLGKRRSHDIQLYDIWLIKTDSKGDTLWTRVYGGEDEERLLGDCIQELDDGGFIITGTKWFDINWWDVMLFKIDPEGDSLWMKFYGTYSWDKGHHIEKTHDGGYIVTGLWHNERLWMLRTDSEGDTLWTRVYWESVWECGYCVRQTTDGGYIVVGQTNSGPAYPNLWLLKTNEYGDTVWYEGSPREILEPQEGDTVAYMIPAAWFKNIGTMPAQNFYCHCEISSTEFHTPDYHVKYLVSYPVAPGDSVLIKFSPWACDDSAQYTARFYTSKEKEPIWQTREKSVTFYGEPWSGVVEDQPINLPHWEIVTSCGREIILQYSGYPQGFQASVFDVAGRKVDEVRACKPSGTVTWGESAPTGVYFIRASGSQAKEVKRFIIMR